LLTIVRVYKLYLFTYVQQVQKVVIKCIHH